MTREVEVKYEINPISVEAELDDGDEVVVELEDVKMQPPPKRQAKSPAVGKAKRKRRLTSNVWPHFEILNDTGIDGKQRCKCKKCGTIFICDSRYGTGNLKRHISTCARRDTRDIGQLIVCQDQGAMAMRASQFDPVEFRELLVAAIVMHDLPFSFVEYAGIRALFKYLEQGVILISRNTAKADVLKMHNREKGRIKRMLEVAPGRISLTSDLWSSVVTDGYICVTAHFLDKDWILQKRVLNFCFMAPPHNGVSLSDKVCSLLSDWGIEKKLFSLTLDNASANDSFIGMLKTQLNTKKALLCNGEFFHIRCCAHILNLIVQDGLKEIDLGVQKIRESVKYVKGSQVRKQKFLECVKLLSLDVRKGLRQDVPTRWNSTFLMLESAIFYRRAFSHLELSDSNYKHCPSPSEWDKIEKISKFLGVFYSITCTFSGTKYPTANLYFPLVFMAFLTLKKHVEGEDEFLKNMAGPMFVKFDKYWHEFSMILAIAVILDPRYKIHFVDFCYKKLYGDSSFEFMKVRNKLHAMFDEYAMKSPMSASPQPSKSNGDFNEQSFNIDTRDVLKEFDDFESEEFSSCPQKSELEQYLDEPRHDRNANLDILAFWKANQFRYSGLASMARDVLSIPISTVASESAFSIGGRVIDQYRSSLKPDVAEALICTRDWVYGAIEAAQVPLDDLAEDVLNLNINKEEDSTIDKASTSNYN